MKIDELKRIAKQTNYRTKRVECELTLFRDIGNDGVILNHILIYLDKQKSLFINNMFCDEKDIQMIKAAVKFAKTPPDEREEEKKFYAKHRCLVQVFTYDPVYLNYDARNEKIYVYDKKQTRLIQTQFTLKEYEEIKKKFNTDLNEFELVEVEE